MTEIHTDIVIIGAGIGGFAAAMSAAENKKVLLVDQASSIGGDSVHANVGTICGAYYRSLLNSPNGVGYSFTKSFIDVLNERDSRAKPYLHADGLYIVPYEWTIFRAVCESFLNDAHVDIKLNTTLRKVEVKGRNISKLEVDQQGTTFSIFAKSVVDCSGNAIVSQLAGIETIKENEYQAASQIFRLTQVESSNEFSLNIAIRKIVLKMISEQCWPQSYKTLSVVPGSLRNSKVDLKLTLPTIITDGVETNKKFIEEARERVEEVFLTLKSGVKSLCNASIEIIFPKPGIRVLQRSMGEHILTEQEVMSCKKFDDGIAIGTWPIEEWNSEGKLNMNYFDLDDGYEIPSGSLISALLGNLYFAGKNISATSRAIASARVMGTGLQTGYAAGKIACARNRVERNDIIKALHHELKQ